MSARREKPGRRSKNPARKAKPVPGTLVPQPNGGALRYGSTQPGPGRPRSKVRAIRKLPVEEQLPLLEAVASDDGAHTAERIRAIEAIGKLAGLG